MKHIPLKLTQRIRPENDHVSQAHIDVLEYRLEMTQKKLSRYKNAVAICLCVIALLIVL